MEKTSQPGRIEKPESSFTTVPLVDNWVVSPAASVVQDRSGFRWCGRGTSPSVDASDAFEAGKSVDPPPQHSYRNIQVFEDIVVVLPKIQDMKNTVDNSGGARQKLMWGENDGQKDKRT
jgi:hypothetical protein